MNTISTAEILEQPLHKQTPPPSEKIIVQEPVPIYRDNVWLIGLVLLAASSLLLAFWPERTLTDDFEGLFTLPYLAVIIYTVVLWSNKRLNVWIFDTKQAHYPTYLLYLSLWIVSCFGLNREIPIFNPSVDWLSAHFIALGLLAATYPWRYSLFTGFQYIWYGALAWLSLVLLYFSIYLFPLMPISAAGFWFFGLSIHAFIPLAFLWHSIHLLQIEWIKENKIRRAIFVGLAIPVLVTAGFLTSWYTSVKGMEKTIAAADKTSANQLPEWVMIGRDMPRSHFTNLVLKTNLFYQVNNWSENAFLPNINIQDKKRHHPLVLIGHLIFPVPELEQELRINILRSFFDARHDLENMLWSGKDLRTAGITTRVRINPSQRYAYTEKVFTIHNSGKDPEWRPNTQEALYTFHLPEGSVVTSLSLWVNGVEEKARLTSRSLADSAYRSIVGIERRDPSIAQWKEGNTVTVRVFPCTPDEDRKFRIGITSPLSVDADELVYRNIPFEGPPATETIENLTVENPDAKNEATYMPTWINSNAKGPVQGQQTYIPDWEIRYKKTELLPATFYFLGNTYTAESYTDTKERYVPDVVYLDINQAWKEQEIGQVLASLGTTPVKYWNDEKFMDINRNNYRSLVAGSLKNRFSLFPFFLIPGDVKPLVISKSAGYTPFPGDMKDSPFGEALRQWSAYSSPIPVFNIGQESAVYLDALKQKRKIQLHEGDMTTLQQLLKDKQFYRNPEDANTVVIPGSNLIISKIAGQAGAGNGDDHLMRLFAYNHILKSLYDYQEGNGSEPETLLAEAAEAFVVSPVSSLIVLETKADYERFGIEKIKNTLGNASFKTWDDVNAGAVPEPHEWALIILLFLSLLWFWRRML